MFQLREYASYYLKYNKPAEGCTVEIEAKYQSNSNDTGLDKSNLLPHVTWLQYQRILNYAEGEMGQGIPEHSVDKIDAKNIRSQTITHPAGWTDRNGKLHMQSVTEERIFSKGRPQNDIIPEMREFREYGINISFNLEIQLLNNTAMGAIVKKRTKQRLSWNIGNIARLDLTKVESDTNGKQDGQRYEVELEFTPVNTTNIAESLELFATQVFIIKRILDDTFLEAKETEKAIMLMEVNSIISGQGYLTPIRKNKLVQVLPLRITDMVYGGLIGNQKTDEKGITKGTRYTATWKVDGIRKLLVFASNGLWLVSPDNHEYNLLSRSSAYAVTIIDGELVPSSSTLGKVNAKYWFVPFDIICYNSQRDIQERPHVERIAQIAQLTSVFTTDTKETVGNRLTLNKVSSVPSYLHVTNKSFVEIQSVDDFYFQMRSMFATEANLPYKTDGIVFTPEDVGYLPGNMDLESWKYQMTRAKSAVVRGNANKQLEAKTKITSDKLTNQRLAGYGLSRVPNVVKWKPRITIDFKIKRDFDRNITLMTAGDGSFFVGDNYNPYNDEVDSNHPLTLNVDNKTVIEYEWIYPDDDKFKDDWTYNKQKFKAYDSKTFPQGLFIPIGLRLDKLDANSAKVAASNWKEIHERTTKDTLIGRTFKLLRKYHNRIKRQLYDDVTVNSPASLTLLDIGGGAGGDYAKWKAFSKVVTVEPDGEKIPELQRRIGDDLDLGNHQKKVTIVQSGGEDYTAITQAVKAHIGDRVDVISIMLSLSFFWNPKNKAMFDGLVATIKNNIKANGKIIFLTIDGNAVERTYSFLEASGVKTIPDLMFGNALLRLNKADNSLVIDIPNTIVRNQTEYLVRLKDLYQALGKSDDYMLASVKPATDELFLSPNERIFTMMYSYGIIDMTDNKSYHIPLAIASVTGSGSVITLTNTGIGLLKAALESLSSQYRMSTSKDKAKMIVELRKELSFLLSITPQGYNNKDITYWELFTPGLQLFSQQLAAKMKNLPDSKSAVEWSLPGVQRLFNSNYPIPQQLIPFIEKALDINIIVVIKDNNRYVVRSVSPAVDKRKYIVLMSINDKWIPIGVSVRDFGNDGIRSVFVNNDPFIVSLLAQTNIVQPVAINADDTFITIATNTFGPIGGLPSAELLQRYDTLVALPDNTSIAFNPYKLRLDKLKQSIIGNKFIALLPQLKSPRSTISS